MQLDSLSFRLAATAQDAPIHFWDAYSGHIRASFRGYNHMDELIAANCVAFNCDATRLIAGYDCSIRLFDPNVSGRKYIELKTMDKKVGQRGLLSCVASDPSNPKRFAVGSYGKQVGVYEEGVGEMIGFFEGHHGGVTHLQFTSDGYRLFSGGRKDPEIICWDTRNMSKILCFLKREVKTHQRMYFDVHHSDHFLVSGNHDGTVSVWDVSTISESDDETVLQHALRFEAHLDCVNGISLHPTWPLMATASGQRHFRQLLDDDSDSMFTDDTPAVDNSLKLWWLEHSFVPSPSSQSTQYHTCPVADDRVEVSADTT